jgi:predicted HicB family RNase H-like nuclease
MLNDPNDWLKVLRAALEIFSGQIIGLAGLPDQKEKREQLLRQHMKDLLRNNMANCIRDF